MVTNPALAPVPVISMVTILPASTALKWALPNADCKALLTVEPETTVTSPSYVPPACTSPVPISDTSYPPIFTL